MNRTVAYQETSNNFTDTRQQIKNAQIATIKNFGVSPPAGGGDFVGQLGIASDPNGEAMLYTYGVGGVWQLVGKSGSVDNLPDVVVMEDRKNNFTEKDQRIEDCPITYLDSGTRRPDQVAIKGPGHIYIYETNPVEIFISADGATWETIRSAEAGDVKLDQSNNFTHPGQTIEGHPIARVLQSSMDPITVGLLPAHVGEVFVQVAEGTTDKKPRMWVASNTSSGWKWEEIGTKFELPATVAQTSKINDFQPTQQTISGKQIMSFVDGGTQNPGDSGIPPDYDGQFYIAMKQNQAGWQDVAMWVGKNGNWYPAQQSLDPDLIAYTDKSNRFVNPVQLLGEGGPNARWLTGARVKHSGASPNSDGNWRVQNVGEVTVYENSSVTPKEWSIWMGVSKNPSADTNAGEWVLIWNSNTQNSDLYARTDKANTFEHGQRITNSQRASLITTGHEGGSVDPQNRIVPMAAGDVFVQPYSHPVIGNVRNIWMSTAEADTASWKRVLTEGDGDVAMVDRPNNFHTRDNFLGLNTDTKRDRVMGARYHNQGSPSGIVGIAPTMFGEVVVTEKYDPADPGNDLEMIVEVHMAIGHGGGARKSWIKLGEAKKKDMELIDDGSNN